jgi:hypothetical protein
MCYLIFLFGYTYCKYTRTLIYAPASTKHKVRERQPIELRDYIGVCTSMTAFCDLHKDKTTYTKFCEDIEPAARFSPSTKSRWIVFAVRHEH